MHAVKKKRTFFCFGFYFKRRVIPLDIVIQTLNAARVILAAAQWCNMGAFGKYSLSTLCLTWCIWIIRVVPMCRLVIQSAPKKTCRNLVCTGGTYENCSSVRC